MNAASRATLLRFLYHDPFFLLARGETRDLLILLPAADRIYEFSPAPCQQHSAVETSWFGELDEHRSLARSIFRFLNRRRFCEPTLACHSPFLRDRAAFRSRKDIYHTLDTRQLSVAPISLPDQPEQRGERERGRGRGRWKKENTGALEILFALGMPIYRLPSTPSGYLRTT